MNQSYNILMTYIPRDSEYHIIDALKKTHAHLPMIVYMVQNPESAQLQSYDRNVNHNKRDGEEDSKFKNNNKIVPFRTRLKQSLKNVQIEASAHSREKFLSDLRKAREITDVAEANDFLEKMRFRLDNPDVLSVDTICQLMISYSRNKGDDRDRSLSTVLNIIDTTADKEALSPDVICLAGRIYKDKFIASNYEDPVVLNSLLGRKGALHQLTDYWDVATYFEVSVLAENYQKACEAALKMAMLKPPVWLDFRVLIQEKQQFLFWSDFFMVAIDADQGVNCPRFPVLIQEFTKVI
uniref:MAP3K TRAFs-binding domain-containing protein n=1 Tax=Heterorhabditis bacteriophora TaxID=37862 RepID=A0A1I7XUV2_HETBA